MITKSGYGDRVNPPLGVDFRSVKVGLFYSTSTGNTEAAAEWIQEKFAKHGDIAAPVDICEAMFGMQAFDSLIVGAPTWNTGAMKGALGLPGTMFWVSLGHWTWKAKKLPYLVVAICCYMITSVMLLKNYTQLSSHLVLSLLKDKFWKQKIEARSSGTHSPENL